MKRINRLVFVLGLLLVPALVYAQALVIDGGTIHSMKGDPFVGRVVMERGVITAVGADVVVPAGATRIDASGLHIYPGLFDAMSTVGLDEVDAVSATNDMSEMGMYNPNLSTATAVHPASEVIPVGPGREGEGERQRRRGHEDFDSLRTFTPGDPLAHVSWKHLARGQGLLTKTYASEEVGSEILDWNALPGLPIEVRLSRLTYWVVMLAQHNHAFGLRLPGVDIPAGLGIEQRDTCLRALALFGRPESPP